MNAQTEPAPASPRPGSRVRDTGRPGVTVTGRRPRGDAAGHAVRVSGLRKAYGPVRAVDGVSFTVEHGEIFALLGPNGAGKSTTLEMLEGFRRRDAGQADVLGIDPGDPARGRDLRESIGLVLQDIAVEPYLTVRETVARNAGYYSDPRDVDEVIELVDLVGKEKRKVRTLSGGQKRRLDLALGVIGNPRLLFLDEPTTGFDPNARRGAWQLVRALRDAGTTILLTTHYMDEAQELADRVAVIAGGRIVAGGTPGTLGGRDTARARITFSLPEDCAAGDLPESLTGARPPLTAAGCDTSGRRSVTVETDEPTAALYRLTGWAFRRGTELEGLTVDRPSLEDVYLSLTGDHTAPAAERSAK